MKRRKFIATTAAAAAGFGLSHVPGTGRAQGSQGSRGKQLLELRLYHFESPAKLKAFDDFLKGAAIPALNRAGVEPVGVFQMPKEENPKIEHDFTKPVLYVLLPHKSPESCVMLANRLGSDGAFLAAGSAVIEAPKSSPAYLRYESTLMLAFDEAPKVEVPTKASTRLMQLRIYESHSTERGLKKIEMFNEGGEIDIFRNCNMNVVFFGQSVVGSKLPNLTYMLGFENKEAQDKAWGAFRDHPAWLKLRKDPAYKDTVSNITNLILRPMPSSQV